MFSGCETFWYEQCISPRKTICWFSGILFSGCETLKDGLYCPSMRLFLLILRNLVFRLRNVQKWAVHSSKGVNLLILMNRVFRVRIIELWAMLSSNEVDLLMFRNRVFSLRNVQICAVPTWQDYAQESLFKVWTRSYMGSVVLFGGRFADVQELRFQTAKRWVIGCGELQGGLFADCQ